MSTELEFSDDMTFEVPPVSLQQLQAQDFAAWQLIGRLDMALEQITAMTDIRKAAHLARRMRSEINAALAVTR